MTQEIYLESTHLKVLKDVGFLYVNDKDGNSIKLVYEWGNDIWTNLIQYFLVLQESIQFYFIY